MKTIELTNVERAALWRTLEDLLAAEIGPTYIGNSEWKRSVFFSDSRAKFLRRVMNKLPDGEA